MSKVETFLEEYKRRQWGSAQTPAGIVAAGVYVPSDAGVKVEVAFATAESKPLRRDAKKAWSDRHGGRASAVLLVIAYPSPHEPRATLVGLHDDAAATDLPLSLVERLVERALEEATTSRAEATLAELFESTDGSITGLRNLGLFATHELTENVPGRSWWHDAGSRARVLRSAAGEDLLRSLGWAIEHKGTDLILRGPESDRERAIAVLLEGGEVFDRPSQRYGSGMSPVEHALGIARSREVTWVIAVQGSRARLYSADPDVGMARTGSASYTEVRVDLLDDANLAYVWLLLSPDALVPGGTVDAILQGSRDHATDLGSRLRERIYVDVVPRLAETIATRLQDTSEAGLQRAYHDTLVVLFRILFVAYAEDRDLLPYRSNDGYRRVALKTRAQGYASALAGGTEGFDERTTETWDSLRAIWNAVFDGNIEWGIPEYGGGLFSQDSDAGRDLERLELTNAEIGPALRAMLVDTGLDGTRGPVDFQALSVREFGTIYEGLLESSLSLAPGDLTIEAKSQAYVPAKEHDEVVVRAGEVYFHNASGARKATGSYFTKDFAVEHLLGTALDPTIAEHLGRVGVLLDEGKESDAAEQFFDFSVADLAMGSGHFLVSAVDHIAQKMTAFLATRPLPGVADELDQLRAAAIGQLERAGVTPHDLPEITHESLLRRQVAKRCIYGADINQIAVDLARLGLWIHTFVPGLPMSSLDHGLVHGNSLTGIGTVAEALDLLEPGKAATGGATSFFYDDMAAGLAAGAEPLARAARLAEANAEEIGDAEALRVEAAQLVAETRAALDAAVAGRLGVLDLRVLTAQGWDAVVTAGYRPAVKDIIGELQPLHFPVEFPEVFRPGLDSPGFDVVLGNPPWEKVKVEEHGWWGLRFPGLRSMSQKEKNAAIQRYRADRPDLLAEYEAEVQAVDSLRSIVKSGPYPLGSGDTDLYKVFCWRDWALLREGGRAGVVFPRGALSGSGTSAWREEILANGAFDDVCFLTNSRQWVFDEVHPQYTVGLTTIRRGGSNSVTFNGPFHSRAEFDAGRSSVLTVTADEFRTWAAGASFPLLPSNDSPGVFRTMRRHPRFDTMEGLTFRPVRELDATGDKALMDFDLDNREGRTPILAGASFNLWNPDFGEPYATADPKQLLQHLQTKRLRQIRTSSSAFYGMDGTDPATLRIHSARIAFRDVARATDSRTVLAALIPPKASFTHKAPYLLPGATTKPRDEAYMLGVLSSIPLDWYSRRYVEITLSFEILSSFPVPQPPEGTRMAQRCVEIAGRLAAVDERFANWAVEVGVPVGSANDPETKDDLVAELDAVVGHLYGLSRNDMEHIFATFHRGWNYAPRLRAVLAHYDRWAADVAGTESAR